MIFKNEFSKYFSNLTKLSRFAINLLLIPHSNVYVERVFSKVNLIKTDLRNLLDVSTVSSIIKIKTFYENEDKLFEPTSDHYMCYKHWIKD